MSNSRRNRRTKQVRRTNQRASQRRMRVPSTTEIVAQMLRHSAEVLGDSSLLDAELAAADIAAPLWATLFDAPRDESEYAAYPALALTRMLETQVAATDQRVLNAAYALALILAASDATDPEVEAASAPLLSRLREAGAIAPPWSDWPLRYELGEMWIMRDPWCTQFDLLIGVSAPDPTDNHTLVVQGDQLRDFQIQRAFVEGPIDEVVSRLQEAIAEAAPRDQILEVLEPVHPATAGGMLQGLLEGTWEADGHDLRAGEDGLHVFSIVQSRFDLLADTHRGTDTDAWHASPVSSTIDDLPADTFFERFAASTAYRSEVAITTPAARMVCDVIGADRLSVWRAQFGPMHAATLLNELDGAGRGLESDAVAELATGVLATMRAYARYADELLGTSPDVTALTIDIIDGELSLQAIASLLGAGVDVERAPGMADRMVAAMVADGIEIGDQAAMDAWIASFNRRPVAERDALFDTDQH